MSTQRHAAATRGSSIPTALRLPTVARQVRLLCPPHATTCSQPHTPFTRPCSPIAFSPPDTIPPRRHPCYRVMPSLALPNNHRHPSRVARGRVAAVLCVAITMGTPVCALGCLWWDVACGLCQIAPHWPASTTPRASASLAAQTPTVTRPTAAKQVSGSLLRSSSSAFPSIRRCCCAVPTVVAIF